MLKSQLIQAFRENDRLRGSSLKILTRAIAEPANPEYGLAEVATWRTKKVPGYHTTSKQKEGLQLAQNQSRITGDLQAYLNVLTGFNPADVNENSFLLIDGAALYEMLFLEYHNIGSTRVYCIYSLQETTKSKALYEEFSKQPG